MPKKVALISGGTVGIGKGAVLQLLEDGFAVSTFSRDAEHCVLLQKELAEKFSQEDFLITVADVTDEKAMGNIVKETLHKFRRIDVLVNNAGFGYFTECDTAEMKKFDEMIQTNLVGVAILTKAVVPQMKKQKSGLIINLASISGKTAFPLGEFYSATKFGVMGYSEAIRKELKEFGIKVCTLCPGMVQTEFFDDKELERRKKRWGGVIPTMLKIDDINRIISTICTQAEHCDIQDLTVMPFP